jgi:hypothetical protein
LPRYDSKLWITIAEQPGERGRGKEKGEGKRRGNEEINGKSLGVRPGLIVFVTTYSEYPQL